jgi:hypothetical protein
MYFDNVHKGLQQTLATQTSQFNRQNTTNNPTFPLAIEAYAKRHMTPLLVLDEQVVRTHATSATEGLKEPSKKTLSMHKNINKFHATVPRTLCN